MSADKLNNGDIGVIDKLLHDGIVRRRLLDFGFIPNTKISVYQRNSGMIAFEVKNAYIALRIEDAKNIILK